jgi:hypothetical protein
MKRFFAAVLSVVIITGMVTSVTSCGEERSTPPNIAFVIDSTRYISKDTALTHGMVFNVAVTASKTGTEGMLSSFSVSKSVNGGVDSTLQQMTFVQQSFAHLFTYASPDSGDVHRYTFTATKRDGLSNSVNLTISGI